MRCIDVDKRARPLAWGQQEPLRGAENTKTSNQCGVSAAVHRCSTSSSSLNGVDALLRVTLASCVHVGAEILAAVWLEGPLKSA